MASGGKVILLSENVAANNTSKASSLGLKAKDVVCSLTISNYVAGTYDCDIEHSHDGVNWSTLASFANLSANGFELVEPVGAVLGLLRAVVVVAGGDADVVLAVNYGE